MLKKKWENPALGAEAGKETIRSSFAEVRHKVPSPGAGAASGQQQCPLGDSTEPQGHSRHGGTMENCGREMEKAESSERSESPGRIEKYNVPLNKLKMMFEKGEATQLKVSSERKKKTLLPPRHQENPRREWLLLLTLQILLFIVLVETERRGVSNLLVCAELWQLGGVK